MVIPDSLASVRSLDDGQRAFLMAFCVVMDRLGRLSKEDADVVFDLMKDRAVATSDEERLAAENAIMEMLEQRPLRIQRLSLGTESEGKPEKLKKWVDFVSARIRECRTAAGLTQEQLAERTGLPQSHISRIENGVHSPSRATLEKVAKALDVPLKDFDPSDEA